jgi:hypothetical protein
MSEICMYYSDNDMIIVSLLIIASTHLTHFLIDLKLLQAARPMLRRRRSSLTQDDEETNTTSAGPNQTHQAGITWQ